MRGLALDGNKAGEARAGQRRAGTSCQSQGTLSQGGIVKMISAGTCCKGYKYDVPTLLSLPPLFVRRLCLLPNDLTISVMFSAFSPLEFCRPQLSLGGSHKGMQAAIVDRKILNGKNRGT